MLLPVVAAAGCAVEPCVDNGAVRVCGEPPAYVESIDGTSHVVSACSVRAGEGVCVAIDVDPAAGPVRIQWPPGRHSSLMHAGTALWLAGQRG